LKVKIQKGIVYNIHTILPNVKTKSVKLTYVISKLLNITEDEYEAIKKAMQPSNEFVEFQTKYQSIISDNNINDSEKKDKIAALYEEYKDIIKEREQQIKEVENLLRDEIEIDISGFPKLTLNEIPDDFPVEAMRILDKLNLISLE
jgi:Fic family protein